MYTNPIYIQRLCSQYNTMTSERITVLIDDDNVKKLRLRQAKLMLELNENVSFSRVINDTLRSNSKKSKK